MGITFFAGERILAGKLSRVQPSVYAASGSGTVAASAVNAPVTGATVTFTTVSPNAKYVAQGIFDVNVIGNGTGDFSGKLYIDGTGQTEQATYGAEVNTDRTTVPQTWSGTLAAAGSHTIDLRATTQSNQNVVGVYTTITVTVYEQS